jgi:hypothetical protein
VDRHPEGAGRAAPTISRPSLVRSPHRLKHRRFPSSSSGDRVESRAR